MLTDVQKTTLAIALKAENNATVVTALAIRDDVTLTNWCNSFSAADAWNESISGKDLFQAMDVTKYDGLTAGKRDAYRALMDYAPHDMAKNTNRKAILDIWGPQESVAVLQACIRKATHAEKYLGGTSATTNTVTALKLTFTGQVSLLEISQALNANP